MKKIVEIIKMSRPVNSAITFVTVFVAAIICNRNEHIDIIVFYASLSAMLVAAAGNIINDIFDFNIDKINKPNRPLPSGKIFIKEAAVFYLIFTIVAFLFSSSVNKAATGIVFLTTIILFFYSYKLKGVPLIGNLAVAFCTGLAFIYGGVAVGNWKLAIIPAVFAFLINLIRELLKDVEDLEGDLKNNLITFPGKYGIEKTKLIIFVFTGLLLFATFYPFVYKIYKIEYFIIVLFTVDLILVYFLKELKKNNINENISKLSMLLKLSMLFGLIAIYVG